MSLQIGDSIIVNDGVTESDESDMDISRWQGRVVTICDYTDNEGIPMVEVEWDSHTLKQMPKAFLVESEEEGLDWQKMVVEQSDVKKTQPRDTISDLRSAQDIIDNISMLGDSAALERWLEQFKRTVRLPLPVVIEDNDRIRKLKIGGIARITGFEMANESYGIIVRMVYNAQKFDFPLCNLKTLNSDTPVAQLIEDYKVWFVNL